VLVDTTPLVAKLRSRQVTDLRERDEPGDPIRPRRCGEHE
jgi:hypothetical protein